MSRTYRLKSSLVMELGEVVAPEESLQLEVQCCGLTVRMLQDASGLKANIPKQWVTTDQRQA